MPIDLGDLDNGSGGLPPSDGPQTPAPGPPTKTHDDMERVFLVVVDRSDEWHCALRFAGRRAGHTGGRVALLHIVEPMEFQHWMAVEPKMRQEQLKMKCSGDT